MASESKALPCKEEGKVTLPPRTPTLVNSQYSLDIPSLPERGQLHAKFQVKMFTT